MDNKGLKSGYGCSWAKGVTSMRKASQNWNILLTSLLNHVNDNITSRKHGPLSVLIDGKEVAIVDWILGMQECGLSITLQQLKSKVINLPKTQITPFKDGILKNSWWYWFKHRHP